MGSGAVSTMGQWSGMLSEGKKMSNVAQKAATAQQQEAQAGYDQYAQSMQPATTAALLQFDKSISAQEKNLARQEELAAQIDPAIIEASQQALRLLKGEQSSALAPLQRQRDQQRQTLLNTLREQLGPGAETSTAGMQALTRFDSETSNLMAGGQQQALGNLGSLMGQFRAAGPDILREASGLGSLASGRYGVQQQTSQGLLGARSGLFQTAGAQYTGEMIRAQNRFNFAKSLHESGQKIGETWATMGMGGGGGSTKTDSPSGISGGGGSSASNSSGGGSNMGYLGGNYNF
jgi:hypothetical protein